MRQAPAKVNAPLMGKWAAYQHEGYGLEKKGNRYNEGCLHLQHIRAHRQL
jgi:hypothetical protein